jgi:hypothetical protein
MRKIWTFGDSFTQGFLPQFDPNNPWADNYCKWKGFVPKVFGEILSAKFDLELRNIGKYGSCNDDIFQRFIEHADQIKPDDIVIVGWTYATRFKIATYENDFMTISHIQEKQPAYTDMGMNGINEMLYNRNKYSVYFKDVINYSKMIRMFCKDCLVIFWNFDGYGSGWEDPILAEFVDLLIPHKNRHRIAEESSEFSDRHYSELGHLQLASDLEDIIKDYINNKNNG